MSYQMLVAAHEDSLRAAEGYRLAREAASRATDARVRRGVLARLPLVGRVHGTLLSRTV
jgi:hypothetical protein